MNHMVACNSRDCPWYRRSSKCRHPLARSENVAKRSPENVPLACPLRREPDIICAPPLSLDPYLIDSNTKLIAKSIRSQVTMWLRLVRIAKGK
jgi:hypothetical protein